MTQKNVIASETLIERLANNKKHRTPREQQKCRIENVVIDNVNDG